jgi:hypothetical protein
MSNANSAYNSKKSNALSACALCGSIFAHESWCASRDPQASYAYQIVLDASKLTTRDSLILHLLAVAWAGSVPTAI